MKDTDAQMPSGVEVRAEFEQRVVDDLLGPATGPSERLLRSDRPSKRYLVGMLAPVTTDRIDPDDLVEAPDVEVAEEDRVAANRKPKKSEQDSGAEGEFVADETAEDREKDRPSLFPSSMGLSFAVDGTTNTLTASLSWGQYIIEVDHTPADARDELSLDDMPNGPSTVWQRHPQEWTFELALAEGPIGPIRRAVSHPLTGADLGLVTVEGRVRRHDTGHGTFRLCEVFVRNEQEEAKDNREERWLFQPHLTLATDDEAPVFVGRGEALGSEAEATDPEQLSLDVQYRNIVEFAFGHGVATHAVAAEDDPRRAVRLETSWLPTYEVPNTMPAVVEDRDGVEGTPELAGLVLDMRELADLDSDALRDGMLPLAEGYTTWLARQRAWVDDTLEGGQRDQALLNIEDATAVADKIRAGIDVLLSDADALAAFRFANRVMWQQRIRTEAIRKVNEEGGKVAQYVKSGHDESVDVPGKRSWRPFQLAFVLLNLPELVDKSHPDRAGDSSLVDLLFFPTGGGKTEAYLGLTAFTFAIRRLHHDRQRDADGNVLNAGEGVAAMMRYTLRLLTAQQFERAAAMVCAAEVERGSDESTWGQEPFRLGMWVGSTVTPNDSDIAKDIIEQARDRGPSAKVYGASPLQLTSCPWCGTGLVLGDKMVVKHHGESHTRRTLVFCPGMGCAFNAQNSPGEGIPIVTVDEEIYRLLPAFVIGTIDKFAQVPWNGATRLLFGLGTEKCERHGWRTPDLSERMRGNNTCDISVGGGPHPAIRKGLGQGPKAYVYRRERLAPPTLIIQDEFHLITGPLGSMAGLYETVVDELSSYTDPEGVDVRPKVVASTATIRRAGQQVRGVFDRGVRTFPPQVVDIADTFFAKQVKPRVIPGRRYMGVCAPPRRLKEIENRVFATLMGAAQDLYSDDGEGLGTLADPYMTTVGYFSSIRELAGMRRLSDEELPYRLKVRNRGPQRPGLRERWRPEVVELTSRVASGEIRKKLDQLGVKHDPADYDEDGRLKDGKTKPVDLLLATNMISVGVDVQRWGSMVVVGQPKSTAEYVQASSRIGRDPDRPGLVVTVYNWSRPRDMSHYETFEHYHATFYKHVEALSVTPFADRALDKALTAVLVGLIRSLDDDANPNSGAKHIDPASPHWQRAVETILERVESVTETPEKVDDLRDQIDRRVADYKARKAKHGAYLAYEQRGEGKANLKPLLRRDNEPGEWNLWTLPNSLRNTEPGVNILFDDTETPPGQPWAWAAAHDTEAADG